MGQKIADIGRMQQFFLLKARGKSGRLVGAFKLKIAKLSSDR